MLQKQILNLWYITESPLSAFKGELTLLNTFSQVKKFTHKLKIHGILIVSYPRKKRDELSSLIIEYLPKNDGEKLMRTIADSYIEKGLTTKAMEIAKRMLEEKIDVKFISSVTGLASDEILKLQSKI